MAIIEKIHEGVNYRVSEGFLEAGGVVHGFSTRLGGVSEGMFDSMNLGCTRGDEKEAVQENYRRFFKGIGAKSPQMVLASQVHEAEIRMVTPEDVTTDPYHRATLFSADGLITDCCDVHLVIFGADCLSILLYDPVARRVAGVHAGWRGTALDIGGKAVEKMVELGSSPKDILVAVGAGIGVCCFETHEDVPEAMKRTLGNGMLTHVHPLEDGKFRVDLKAINRELLLARGVKEVAVCPDCTACLPEIYWSHRRMQGERGSQAAVIGLRGGAG